MGMVQLNPKEITRSMWGISIGGRVGWLKCI